MSDAKPIVIPIEEGDQQLILLSLALCSIARPGFDDALRRIAETLNGENMFESFKELNKPAPPLAVLEQHERQRRYIAAGKCPHGFDPLACSDCG